MFYLSKDEITFEAVENFCKEWPEGVRVEYKQEIQIRKHIPKIVSAFANTQGGIFFIGVEADQTNNKAVFPIEGIPDPGGIEEAIIQSAITGIYPSVMPEVIKVPVPGSDNVVVVVRVDESVNAPHAIQNETRVYIRTGSVTQPYELAEIDRIEYLLKRRQDTQIVKQQILTQIENRMQLVCRVNVPTLKFIASPVFAYRPVISPTRILDVSHNFSNFYGFNRVPGGVCYFSELSPFLKYYIELNEHGIVYYATRDFKDVSRICMSEFIDGIARLLLHAKRLYNECEALVSIEVVAELVNVFGKELLIDTNGLINHPPNLVCNTSEFSASTSTPYLSRDLNDATKQQKIYEDLTMQLLWSFNVPTDNVNLIKIFNEMIEPHIEVE